MHRGHGSDRPQEENDTSKQWHEHKTQQIEIPHEERQKKWYDLDDQRKKELEVRTFGLVLITISTISNPDWRWLVGRRRPPR
jgi:hypothetical protein